MSTTRIKIFLAVTLAFLGTLMVWQFQRGTANLIQKTTGSQGTKSISKLDFDSRSLAEKSIGGTSLNTISAAERRVGYSIKAPQRLFGQDARIFVNTMASASDGRRGVTISYSNETTPSYSRGFIQMGPRYPGLASYAISVAGWQKEGLPYTLRQHKGSPGYTLEKGFNNYPNGKSEARPAGVVWLVGDIEYQVWAPLDMGLDELVPIADSLD